LLGAAGATAYAAEEVRAIDRRMEALNIEIPPTN
jgi:hypothetical protein